jgi:hypothetical protein
MDQLLGRRPKDPIDAASLSIGTDYDQAGLHIFGDDGEHVGGLAGNDDDVGLACAEATRADALQGLPCAVLGFLSDRFLRRRLPTPMLCVEG